MKVKTLRQISTATILSLMLAVSVLAGQVESPAVLGSPQPPSSTVQTTSAATAIVLTVLRLIYR